jgi:hypothetical protein
MNRDNFVDLNKIKIWNLADYIFNNMEVNNNISISFDIIDEIVYGVVAISHKGNNIKLYHKDNCLIYIMLDYKPIYFDGNEELGQLLATSELINKV